MRRLPNVNDVLAHANEALRTAQASTVEKTASAPTRSSELAVSLEKLAESLLAETPRVTLSDVVIFHQRLMRT